MRCFVLQYCWRWMGYSFGFDVLIQYDSRTGLIAVKRNTKSQPCTSAVSLQPKKILMIRLRVTSFQPSSGNRNEVHTHQDTGVVQFALSQDEENPLITVDSRAEFPLYIAVNMALTSAEISFDDRNIDSR